MLFYQKHLYGMEHKEIWMWRGTAGRKGKERKIAICVCVFVYRHVVFVCLSVRICLNFSEVESIAENIISISSVSQPPELDKMKKMNRKGKETSIISSMQYSTCPYIAFQNIST